MKCAFFFSLLKTTNKVIGIAFTHIVTLKKQSILKKKRPCHFYFDTLRKKTRKRVGEYLIDIQKKK